MVKDEPFLEEFIQYHLWQGVDFIHIVDDGSNPPVTIQPSLAKHVRIWTAVENNGDAPAWGKRAHVFNLNKLYHLVRRESEWFTLLDADEFLCTRKHASKSVAEELRSTFSQYDCVKVPWVMMACGEREEDPESLLLEIRHRWNHDLRHPHPYGWHKGRCRYEAIEVKSLFRSSAYAFIDNQHCPRTPVARIKCANSVRCEPALLNSHHSNLRERDIEEAYMVCYHYRLISRQSCQRKQMANDEKYHVATDSIMASDHAEVRDDTMGQKWSNYLSLKPLLGTSVADEPRSPHTALSGREHSVQTCCK